MNFKSIILLYTYGHEYITLLNGPQKLPFSHAVRAGNLLFITGQMPTLKNNKSKLISGGIEEQTHQVMKNLIDVLKGVVHH